MLKLCVKCKLSEHCSKKSMNTSQSTGIFASFLLYCSSLSCLWPMVERTFAFVYTSVQWKQHISFRWCRCRQDDKIGQSQQWKIHRKNPKDCTLRGSFLLTHNAEIIIKELLPKYTRGCYFPRFKAISFFTYDEWCVCAYNVEILIFMLHTSLPYTNRTV